MIAEKLEQNYKAVDAGAIQDTDEVTRCPRSH
jgi:hypothetical protein